MYSNKITIFLDIGIYSIVYRENYNNLSVNDISVTSLILLKSFYKQYYELTIQNKFNFLEIPFEDKT